MEQGISNWISEFLRTYHGFNPETEGAATVGLFWGMMTVGCILGLVLLKIIDSKIVLRIFAVCHICCSDIYSFRKCKNCAVWISGTGLLSFSNVRDNFFPCSEQCNHGSMVHLPGFSVLQLPEVRYFHFLSGN